MSVARCCGARSPAARRPSGRRRPRDLDARAVRRRRRRHRPHAGRRVRPAARLPRRPGLTSALGEREGELSDDAPPVLSRPAGVGLDPRSGSPRRARSQRHEACARSLAPTRASSRTTSGRKLLWAGLQLQEADLGCCMTGALLPAGLRPGARRDLALHRPAQQRHRAAACRLRALAAGGVCRGGRGLRHGGGRSRHHRTSYGGNKIVRRKKNPCDRRHWLAWQTLVRRLLTGEMGMPAEITVFSRDERSSIMRLEFLHRDAATDDIIYQNSQNLLNFELAMCGIIRRRFPRSIRGMSFFMPPLETGPIVRIFPV